MNEAEIKQKLRKCEADMRNTNSRYRKRDLQKYHRKLIKELNTCRRNC